MSLQKGGPMFKHASVAILVLCFVCTFLTMIYQYGSRGWAYESNIPNAHGPSTHGGSQHGMPGEQGTVVPSDSPEHHPNADHTALPSDAAETPSHAEPAVETSPDATTEAAVSPTPGATPTGGSDATPQPTPGGGDANQREVPGVRDSGTPNPPRPGDAAPAATATP